PSLRTPPPCSPRLSTLSLHDALPISDPATEIAVDIERRIVEAPGVRPSFEIDDFARTRLLEGLDDIALTLRYEVDVAAYERKRQDRKSTRLNSSHEWISYAVFCLKKK